MKKISFSLSFIMLLFMVLVLTTNCSKKEDIAKKEVASSSIDRVNKSYLASPNSSAREVEMQCYGASWTSGDGSSALSECLGDGSNCSFSFMICFPTFDREVNPGINPGQRVYRTLITLENQVTGQMVKDNLVWANRTVFPPTQDRPDTYVLGKGIIHYSPVEKGYPVVLTKQ